MAQSPVSVSAPSRWDKPKKAALLMGVLVVVLFGLELIDTILLGALDNLGIRSFTVSSLPMILVAPWLHFGWAHLFANAVPFAVLGFLIRVTSTFAKWLAATVISIVVSGLAAWLLSPPNTIVAGASGLIFGWLTFLLARGIFNRDWKQIVLAVVVFVVYGSVLWGVLPQSAGVSWQAHLGGAIGGVLAAWWLRERRAAKVNAAPAR